MTVRSLFNNQKSVFSLLESTRRQRGLNETIQVDLKSPQSSHKSHYMSQDMHQDLIQTGTNQVQKKKESRKHFWKVLVIHTHMREHTHIQIDPH